MKGITAHRHHALQTLSGRSVSEQREQLCRFFRRSWIVQVSELKGCRRNELEILLRIFDQTTRMNDHHILNWKI
ncbi:MAG: hypothetical protein LBS09_07165 [Bacteroidales bacterium]|nr:hypothetical protein [Bacteroidales bacterium]